MSKMYPCFMVEEEAMPPDQRLSWHCCSLKEYLYYKLTGKKKVRIDWYSQLIPRRW